MTDSHCKFTASCARGVLRVTCPFCKSRKPYSYCYQCLSLQSMKLTECTTSWSLSQALQDGDAFHEFKADVRFSHVSLRFIALEICLWVLPSIWNMIGSIRMMAENEDGEIKPANALHGQLQCVDFHVLLHSTASKRMSNAHSRCTSIKIVENMKDII